MKCSKCGEQMRHNVPRLGDKGGFIHANTGYVLCEEEALKLYEEVFDPNVSDYEYLLARAKYHGTEVNESKDFT